MSVNIKHLKLFTLRIYKMFGYFLQLKFRTLVYLILVLIFTVYLIQGTYLFGTCENKNTINLVWWTSLMPDTERLVNCYNNKYSCMVRNKNNFYNTEDIHPKAFLFYGSTIDENFPLPRTSSDLWAIFHEESPKNYAPFLYKETQNLFNITSTFSRYSNFPVTLQYLENINSIIGLKYYIPLEVKNRYLDEIAPVLYIQSDCDTPIERDLYIKDLMNYVKVDSYGKCLRNKDMPKVLSDIDGLDLYNVELMKFVSRYKFIISFENAICNDYITEKFWRPIIVGSIPIYLGSPTVEDWLPNKNSAILAKDFKDVKSLASFIHKLNNDDVLYEKFMEHKLLSKIENKHLKEKYEFGVYGLDTDQDHPITAFECYVCREAHEKTEFEQNENSVYDCPVPESKGEDFNSWKSHWRIGKCQSNALVELIGKENHFTKSEYNRLWKKYLDDNDC